MRKKIIILMLIFSLSFSVPIYTSQGAAFVLWVVKEFGLDLVARALSRRLLTILNDKVVGAINQLGTKKGGNPGPAFVQNWKSFLADAKRIGENQFRAQLNYAITKGIICNDLKGPLALAFEASNVPYVNIGEPDKIAELQQDIIPYQTKIKCTIPDSVRETFKKSFEKGGGWETWSRLVEPQNNLAGALAISMEELARQRASQETAKQSEVAAASGFTGIKDSCKGFGKDAECSFGGDIITPGDLMSEGAADWLDSNSKWFVSSDELSEVIINIISAATAKLNNFLSSKTFGLLGTPANPDSKKGDLDADQSGGKTAGAKNDCLSLCIEAEENSCDRVNLFTFPATRETCSNDGRAKCERQCTVP